MGQVHNFSFGSFEWFVGEVENRDDPKKLGRLQVRIFGYHGDEGTIPTSDLPWAVVLQDITSSASKGIGQAPIGAQKGTHVVGFFADGKNAQTPIIMGSLGAAPEDRPDTNNLARGENLQDTIIASKKSSAIISKATGNALSALSNIENFKAKITDTFSGAKGTLGGIKDTFSGFGDTNLMSSINGLSSVIAQIQENPLQADALKSVVDSHVIDFKTQIDSIRSLDPTTYLQSIGKVGNLTASVDLLKNLNFDNALQSIQSVSNALGKISSLTSAISAMGSLSGIVSIIEGLASTIPGFGPITALNKTIAASNIWPELQTVAAPKYPFNRILETEGGHFEEYDNTPGKERYHQYHPAGTFQEVHPDGSKVDKIVKDKYTVVMGDDYLHVEGNVKVNIIGNSTIVVNGDATTTVSGNKVDVVKGDYSIAVGGSMSITAAGSFQESSNLHFAVTAPRIDLN